MRFRNDGRDAPSGSVVCQTTFSLGPNPWATRLCLQYLMSLDLETPASQLKSRILPAASTNP